MPVWYTTTAPLYYYCSQVLYDPKWKHLLQTYLCVKYISLKIIRIIYRNWNTNFDGIFHVTFLKTVYINGLSNLDYKIHTPALYKDLGCSTHKINILFLHFYFPFIASSDFFLPFNFYLFLIFPPSYPLSQNDYLESGEDLRNGQPFTASIAVNNKVWETDPTEKLIRIESHAVF